MSYDAWIENLGNHGIDIVDENIVLHKKCQVMEQALRECERWFTEHYHIVTGTEYGSMDIVIKHIEQALMECER